MLKDGVPVTFTNENGELEKDRKLRVFDFDDYHNNHFLAVRQFEVCGELYNRRPDVIGFVNGIPLVFFELKAHHSDLRNAYEDNLKDYKDTISQVFHCNTFTRTTPEEIKVHTQEQLHNPHAIASTNVNRWKPKLALELAILQPGEKF